MNDIRVRYLEMPLSVKGFTVREDVNSYDVYINPAFDDVTQRQTLEHELSHINNHDFDKSDIQDAERSDVL